MIFTPHPYQEIMADHVFTWPRSALWAPMGFGKTVTMLYAVDALLLGTGGPALAIAPKRVAHYTWPNEVRKWDGFSHLEACPIIGTAEKKQKALLQHANLFTVNYENLPWLVNTLGDRWPFKIVIADESTRLKNFRLAGGRQRPDDSPIKTDTKVSRARSLARVAFSKVKNFIELTGTPSPNGLNDLWGQLWFLDRGARLGSSYSAFIARWFRYEGEDMETRRLVPMPYAQAEIQDRVKDICMSLQISDWFNVEDFIIRDVPVYLDKKVMDQYKYFEREMYIKIVEVGAEIEAKNAAALTTKCLQIANGAVYTDESRQTFTTLHDAKLEALDSIIEESAGASLLIVYHFRHDLARIKARYPDARQLDDSGDIEALWNAGKVTKLIVHPDSAGHGLNLQDGGYIVVIFGHWWDLEKYQQVIERVGPVRQMQSGHPRPVYVYNIRSVGTIDTVVISRRTNKRRIQDLLLDSARRV